MTEQAVITKAEFLASLQRGWDEFQAYISTLTEAQITQPTDAAGWTTKDHVIHMVAWEDSVYALLKGLPRREYMGIDADTWNSNDYDRINEVIRQKYLDLSWAKVQERFRQVHQRLIETIQPLSDEDLYRPYVFYQPDVKSVQPVMIFLTGNTYDHYAEHTPWIDKIVHPA